MGVRCVFSREAVQRPDGGDALDGGLNCHGYGSSVMLTASMGFAAAAEAVKGSLALSPLGKSVESLLPSAGLMP
jgi:tRNA A37 threonylcarbamoyladenosine dehydratase